MRVAHRAVVGVVVILAAAIGVGIAMRGKHREIVAKDNSTSTYAPPQNPKVAKEVDAAINPAGRGTSPVDHAARFRDAKDLWAFLEERMPAANDGSASAQYQVYAALSECQALDVQYFKAAAGSATRRTLDEAMQMAVKMGGFSFEDVKTMYGRCRRILESADPPFGDANDWLRAAARSGWPMAQARLAMSKALESRSAASQEVRLAASDEARALVRASLRAKDPDAMVVAGDVGLALGGFDDAARAQHEWVWLLAACQRRMNCTANSEWYRLHCRVDPACQPFETGVVDVVRRLTGSRFEELEQRAAVLNSMLDQDRIQELRF